MHVLIARKEADARRAITIRLPKGAVSYEKGTLVARTTERTSQRFVGSVGSERPIGPAAVPKRARI